MCVCVRELYRVGHVQRVHKTTPPVARDGDGDDGRERESTIYNIEGCST